MSQYDARATPSDADLTAALREFSASVAAFTAAVADLERVVERGVAAAKTVTGP